MKPNIKLAETTTHHGAKLDLTEHDGNFYIRSDGEILMQSRANWSEKELGRIGCDHLISTQKPRVLVGGMGMGFTLVEVCLELQQKEAQIDIIEISDDLLEWNEKYMKGLHSIDPFEDKRVNLIRKSLEEHLDEIEPETYDVIMTDVDNGPIEWGKGSLYSPEGLERFRRVIKKDGLLLIWTAKAIRSFDRKFRKAGFWVDCHHVPAFEQHKDGKPKGRGRVLSHAIWEGMPTNDLDD